MNQSWWRWFQVSCESSGERRGWMSWDDFRRTVAYTWLRYSFREQL